MDAHRSSPSVAHRHHQGQDQLQKEALRQQRCHQQQQHQQQQPRHLQVVAPLQRSRSQGNILLLQEPEDLVNEGVDYFDSEEAMPPDSTYPHRRALSPDSCTIRRSNKPLMEKKRRQRINRCLNELKSLVFEAVKRDPCQYSKLEKADILEMTVRHVQVLHRQEQQFKTFIGSDEGTKYRAGFSHCTTEVTKLLESMDHDIPPDLHQKIVKHLNSVVTPVTSVNSVNNVNSCSANVQNSVHVGPSQPPIILVLQSQPQVNTTQVVPITQVSTATTLPIAHLPLNHVPGNSMGAQPSIMVLPSPVQNQQSCDNINTMLSEQHTNNLISHGNNSSNRTVTLLLPSGIPIVSSPNNFNLTQQNEVQLTTQQSTQDESPVLAAILNSNKIKKSSHEYHSSGMSSTTSECHSRFDSEDNSDLDTSSRLSSPVSFMSMSPVPDERTNSPHFYSSSHGSNNSSLHTSNFREELVSSVGAMKYNSCKGQPTLAPKPSCGNSVGSSYTFTGSCRPTSKVSPRISSSTSKPSQRNDSLQGKKSTKSHSKSSDTNKTSSLPILIPPQPPKEVLDTSSEMWRPW